MKTKVVVDPSYVGFKSKQQDVLFFGEAPWQDEIDKGQAFVGVAGQCLRRIIEAEIPGRNCTLDNICPEYLGYTDEGKIAKPMAKKRNEYEEYRTKSIKKHKPKVIVLLGEYAMKSFGVKGRPVAKCGEIQEIEVDKKRYKAVCSVHPSYVCRNPKQVKLYQKVFRSIRQCLKKTSKRLQTCLDNTGAIRTFLKRVAKRSCTFDIETSSLDPAKGVILCCSITCSSETAWIPLFHRDSLPDADARWKEVASWWSKGPRRCHNAQFELKWMRDRGVPDPPKLYDTRLRAWLIDETISNGLNNQVVHVLEKPAYWLALDMYDKKQGYGNVPLNLLGEYNAQDTIHQDMLYEHQEPHITPVQRKLCDEVLTPLAGVLGDMERRGFHVDRDILKKEIRKAKGMHTRRMNQIERDFPGLNINSPKQMAKLMFDDLGLQPTGYNPPDSKGNKSPQTDIEAVTRLSKQQPKLAPIVDAKKASSFVRRMQPWVDVHIDPKGLIHPDFNLGTVNTGRLSMSNPNLQNIDRYGAQRLAMTSRYKGGVIIQGDYMQHELRILAAQCGQMTMLEAFREGQDLHQIMADRLKCDRFRAKCVNFSIVYGITAHGLLSKNGIPYKDGSKLLRKWFKENPEVKQYQQDKKEELQEYGYVESIFGWRRHGLDPDDDRQLRQGYNAPIQNAAVVFTYMALVALDKYLSRSTMKTRIVLQVHDSIVLDAPKREEARAKRVLHDAMMFRLPGQTPYEEYLNGTLEHDIPLGVEVKSGATF